MYPIRISVGEVTLPAELNDSPTARAVWDALPLEGRASVWGDEVYFETPVEVAEAPDATTVVELGALAYWPLGRAFCVFYGPTPVSLQGEPRAYSPVNVIGRITGEVERLRGTPGGVTVRVIRAALA